MPLRPNVAVWWQRPICIKRGREKVKQHWIANLLYGVCYVQCAWSKVFWHSWHQFGSGKDRIQSGYECLGKVKSCWLAQLLLQALFPNDRPWLLSHRTRRGWSNRNAGNISMYSMNTMILNLPGLPRQQIDTMTFRDSCRFADCWLWRNNHNHKRIVEHVQSEAQSSYDTIGHGWSNNETHSCGHTDIMFMAELEHFGQLRQKHTMSRNWIRIYWEAVH